VEAAQRLSSHIRLQQLLVLGLIVFLSLQAISNQNVVFANNVHPAFEANSPSIPNYQWQFLSPSEKAAVDASLKVIMSERFNNITLNIVDASGVPFTGTVRVTQNSTSFLHAAGWPGVWADYLAMTPSRTYVMGAYPRGWNVVERVRGTFDFSQIDELDALAWHGIIDFHLKLTPTSIACCSTFPEWANVQEYESFKEALQRYVNATVTHFKGRVQYYELWEEANGNFGNDNWPLEHIIDIIKMEAVTIRAIDPNAQICIDLTNFTNQGPNNWSVEYFVQTLLSAGAPFDVIGVEMHYGNQYPSHAGGIDTLYDRLNVLAKFGKPLYIWEDGLPSSIDPGSMQHWESMEYMWHGSPNEEKQAEFMVAETLVYLGNPSVLGVQWWALQDNPDDHYHYGVISYPDGARKKSFYALEQLWNSLMTNETVQCVNGVATFRGLAGNYSISVEGYEAEPSVVHVSDRTENMFSLLLRSQALRDQASQILSKVGSNLTATGGEAFRSSEAKNLLSQALDEYHMAEQALQSKDYARALQHAQKALDLIREAYLKESEYAQEQQQLRQQQEQQQLQEQRQQLLTRIVETVGVVAVVGACAAAALSYIRRRKPGAIRHTWAHTRAHTSP
jgi:GH35 family endo-1,4-beta-xylanase